MISMTGLLSGGTAPFSVQWQTDKGYSGKASVSTLGTANEESWNTGAISLVNGPNTINVTAYDSARGNSTATGTVTLASPQAPGAGVPISVLITAPASSVSTINASTTSLAGTAVGGSGIAKVTWQTSTGAVGTATGTGHWLAPSVPLLTGTNTVVIRAYDANGKNAWAAKVIVRNH
jgi:hypothetical protein